MERRIGFAAGGSHCFAILAAVVRATKKRRRAAAVQNAIARTKAPEQPPGFGVRPKQVANLRHGRLPVCATGKEWFLALARGGVWP